MLRQNNISIVDGGRNRALTDIDITIETLMTSRETKNLSRRVSGGTQANIEHRKKITKRLVWGYHRNYPRGPIVCLDKAKAETIREIHRMFDEGIPLPPIIRHLNHQCTKLIERYPHPR